MKYSNVSSAEQKLLSVKNILDMLKQRHLYLIGLSGSGKSTVAKILAKKLNRTFVDIDKMIEKHEKKTISRIFEDAGESKFRKMEATVLQKLAQTTGRPKVVALGGGTFESPANRKLVADSGISIWLRCPIKELSKRLDGNRERPLLIGGGLNRRLGAQLRKRTPNFRRADLKVLTAKKSPVQVSLEIIRKLMKKYAAN